MPRRIVSYRQAGDQSGSFDRLTALGRDHGITVEDDRHPSIDQDRDCLVFLIGWQFMLSDGLARCVVFHRLLLPFARGFSPTVTALLSGADRPRHHCFFAGRYGPGTRPICGSRTIPISPGISLQAALDLQAIATADLAVEVLHRFAAGNLAGRVQNHGAATYSLWRDRYDYFLDWRSSATDIFRHIQALGFPYEGAKGALDGEVLTIHQAEPGPDLSFVIRDPGKLWQIADRRALVVCGLGTLWIERASDRAGGPFHFKSLRSRFLTADTAWIAPFLGTPNTGI